MNKAFQSPDSAACAASAPASASRRNFLRGVPVVTAAAVMAPTPAIAATGKHQWAMLIDVRKCIGCQACTAACKTGNELPAGVQYIHLIEQTRGVFPDLQGGFQNHRCYHCADAACVQVCPAGALYKQDGLTRLDGAKCTGCTYCVDACPFGVPVMVNEVASKCDACAAVTAAGGTPWCVKTCPSHALMYGERSAILAEAQRRAA